MISQIIFIGLLMMLISCILPIIPIKKGVMLIKQLTLSIGLVALLLIWLSTLLLLITKQSVNFIFYDIISPFTLSFTFDNLNMLFVLLIAGVACCVLIYSWSYIDHYTELQQRLLLSLMMMFIFAMLCVVISDNTLSFLFFWELMALSSFFLVMLEYENPENQKAGLFYFIMTQLSTAFLFYGFFSLYSFTKSFKLHNINLQVIPESELLLIMCALFIGFSIKAGLIPVHKWLPYAHPCAPAPVSALMSGLMLKIAIYGFLLFFIEEFPYTLEWGILFLIIGTLSTALGIIYALKEVDVKRFLAYHSIENIGIIVTAIGLCITFYAYGNTVIDQNLASQLKILGQVAYLAAILHTINHALFKSILFLGAGSVINVTHIRDMNLMGGLIKKMPYSAVLFLAAALSIAAIPPFNGFISELLIYQLFFQSNIIQDPIIKGFLIICLSIFALAGALAAAGFVKAFGSIFLAGPRSNIFEHEIHEVPRPMLIGQGILVACCLIIGLFSLQIFQLGGYILPLPDMFWIGILSTIPILLILWLIHKYSCSDSRITETWGCGYTFSEQEAQKTEYTSKGIVEPIITEFKVIYRTKKKAEITYFDPEYKSIVKEGSVEISTLRFFEEYLYAPIVRTVMTIAKYIAKLQNNNSNTYILYVFLTMVILFIAIMG